MSFRKLLNKQTSIIAKTIEIPSCHRGQETGEMAELWSIQRPEEIIRIHRASIDAGANIICSNTLAANRYNLARFRYSVEEIVIAALQNAHRACQQTAAKIALTIGPIAGENPSFDDAYLLFQEIVTAGSKNADLILIENITTLQEIRAAVIAAKENSSLPVLCVMPFADTANIKTVAAMVLTISSLGVDALGISCSQQTEQLLPILEEFTRWTNLPLIVRLKTAPSTKTMDKLLEYGVSIIGGNSSPDNEMTAHLARHYKNRQPKKRTNTIPAAVCSATRVALLNRPTIVGERINPTGKKRLQQALTTQNFYSIAEMAAAQAAEGAEIVDINVGMPGIDQQTTMAKVIEGIQQGCDIPLQLDSGNPALLAQALRLYNGKAIINSVNGTTASMQKILPLARQYGAAIIGLCFDENGIPDSAEGRFTIAEKIYSRAISLDIAKENIIIDCLALTIAAQQEIVLETVEAIKMVKERLGVRTILGISNISFGLPGRSILNHNFLAMALYAGLDLAIVDPGQKEIIDTIHAYRLLANIDTGGKKYRAMYNNAPEREKGKS